MAALVSSSSCRSFNRLLSVAYSLGRRNDLHVSRAELVNILEDSLEDLDVTTDTDKEEIDLGEFRAFEVKTVRLHL